MNALDIAAPEGAVIKTPMAGTVVFVGTDPDFGNLIVIDHGKGFLTRYGHCQKVLVNKDQFVTEDQKIGLVGNTGRSTAPHLHYEVLDNGKPVDPLTLTFEKHH